MPGQLDPQPWPDKVFVLEHKGVDEHPTTKSPIVWIRIRQLLTHLTADRARGGRLVYYVLPDVEWPRPTSAPYGRVPSVAARRTKGVTWDGFQLWACVAHVEDLLSLLASIFVADPSRFSYRAARGSRKDDWICGLTMGELWAIPDGLPPRDFISCVRDCTRGRLITDPGVTGAGPPAPSFGLPQSLGPSGGTLANALGVGPPDGGAEGRAERSQLAVDADDLAEVFDRTSVATFFGIGDSDEEFPHAASQD